MTLTQAASARRPTQPHYDVSIFEVGANSAVIKLGAGNDSLSVTDTTISTSSFDGGTGVNVYYDGGANSIPNLTKRHFS